MAYNKEKRQQAIKNLSVDWINKFVQYNPDTGEFIRIGALRNNFVPGQRAEVYSGGYYYVCLGGLHVPAHRVAWFLAHEEWPDCHIDHINRDRKDNRLCNLRKAEKWQNNLNKSTYKNNKSSQKGVNYHIQRRKWQASIGYRGERIYIGLFETFEEAKQAYLSKEKELFGEFRGGS